MLHQYDSDASRPLLEKERERERERGGFARLSQLLQPPPSVTSDSSGRDDSDSLDGFDACRKRQLRAPPLERKSESRGLCADCAEWFCWKWIFPTRVADYEDFASSAEMGEIYHIRQKARELFDPAAADDHEMLHQLWNGLYPMLPFEGRVNPRWRDIGFQNDDPASDLRASGRLALQMLLFFSDHRNDDFKRMIRENRFPVCLCALNLLEILLVHLNLKDPLPLVCPCCGTENAELETSQPSRHRPELVGFVAVLNDVSGSASSSRHSFTEWPVELALAHLFAHAMIVLDAVWKRALQRDPSTTLLHFREALVDTRLRLMAFLSRRNSPLTLAELEAWSYRQRLKLQGATKTV